VGSADKFTGLLIEKMLLIGYIREKQWANQDKSHIELKMRSARWPTLRSTESEGVAKYVVRPPVGAVADPTKYHGFADKKGQTKNVERLWIPVCTGMTSLREGDSSHSRTRVLSV
jgi:hypothetical protein